MFVLQVESREILKTKQKVLSPVVEMVFFHMLIFQCVVFIKLINLTITCKISSETILYRDIC